MLPPSTDTQLLMGLIEGRTFVSPQKVPDVLELARLNKVRLEAMRRLSIGDGSRTYEEARLASFAKVVKEVVGVLEGIEYSLIKLFKPVAYVPSDLDLLTTTGDGAIVCKRLKELGFRYVVLEPNCITMRRDIAVDVYFNPDFMNLPYMCGRDLLEYSRKVSIYGIEGRALAPEAEAVLVCAHSVYKEQLITLNDLYALREFVRPSSLGIARALKVESALQRCLSAVKKIESGASEAPYRLPSPVVAEVFIRKLLDDRQTRRGVRNLFPKLKDARLPALVVSRLTRKTY